MWNHFKLPEKFTELGIVCSKKGVQRVNSESISGFLSSVCNVYRQLLFPRSIYVKIKKKIKKAIIRVTYSNFVSYNVGIDGIDTTPIGCRDEFVRFVRKLRTFLSPWQWRFQSGPWNESSWSFEIFHFWFFQPSNTRNSRI